MNLRTLCLGAAVALATACAITTPDGKEYGIRPWGDDEPVPAGGKKIGEFTDANTGVTYELYDLNNDVSPDFAKNPETGQTFHVTPGESPNAPLILTPTSSGLTGAVGGVNVHPDNDPSVSLYVNLPETLMPVRFEQSAAEYLADYGLDQIEPGKSAYLSEGFDVNAFDVVDLEAMEFALDVTVHWNAAFGWPSMLDYPELQYEFHALSDLPGGFAEYIVLRVVGPDDSVIPWLAELGIEDVSLPGIEVFPGTFASFLLTVDQELGMASVFADGQLIKTYSL